MIFKHLITASAMTLAALSMTLLSSCSEDSVETPQPVTPEPVTPPSPKGGPGVYVGGTALNDFKLAATYWKNGEATYLEATHAKGVFNTTGFDITVDGDDVYVAGVASTGDGLKAVYWKNGVPKFLSEEHSQATYIRMAANDLYVAGLVQGTNGKSNGILWKNGTVYKKLSLSDVHSNVSGMVTSGTDVYVSGSITTDGITRPVYWKNSVEVPLEVEAAWSIATSIEISGSDLYVTGFFENEMGAARRFIGKMVS